MKAIVIEDDERKRRKIVEHLEPLINGEIVECASYNSGLSTLLREKHDLIFLDMTMPTFDISPNEPGGRPQPFAGRRILAQIKRRKIQGRAIVITQFGEFGDGEQRTSLAELDKELKAEFPKIYFGCVYYHTSQDLWQSALTKLVLQLCEKINAERSNS